MGGRQAKFWRPNYFVWLSSRIRVGGGGIAFFLGSLTLTLTLNRWKKWSVRIYLPLFWTFWLLNRWFVNAKFFFAAAVSDFDCSASCSGGRGTGEEGGRNQWLLSQKTHHSSNTATMHWEVIGKRREEDLRGLKQLPPSLAPIGKLIPNPPNDREPVAPQKFHFFQWSCNEEIWQKIDTNSKGGRHASVEILQEIYINWIHKCTQWHRSTDSFPNEKIITSGSKYVHQVSICSDAMVQW